MSKGVLFSPLTHTQTDTHESEYRGHPLRVSGNCPIIKDRSYSFIFSAHTWHSVNHGICEKDVTLYHRKAKHFQVKIKMGIYEQIKIKSEANDSLIYQFFLWNHIHRLYVIFRNPIRQNKKMEI